MSLEELEKRVRHLERQANFDTAFCWLFYFGVIAYFLFSHRTP